MPKYKAKTDSNQKRIVKMLRAVGASVATTHAAGKGFPDLVVGFRGENYLLEVKDGKKPPSKRQLTPDQKIFHEGWRGQIAVVKNADEALQAIGAVEA